MQGGMDMEELEKKYLENTIKVINKKIEKAQVELADLRKLFEEKKMNFLSKKCRFSLIGNKEKKGKSQKYLRKTLIIKHLIRTSIKKRFSLFIWQILSVQKEKRYSIN